MLQSAMAGNLLKRLREHLDYNINIMDDQGIIIASCDESRIGLFHESAFRIVSENLPIEVIRPGQQHGPGVRPGVNLPVIYENNCIGVVGITGSPDEVLNLAYAVKTSLETLLEYSLYKEQMARRQDRKNQFLYALLYEENANPQELSNMASNLGYRDQVWRIPILFRLNESGHPGIKRESVLEDLKSSPLHTKQDITLFTLDGNPLVFRCLEKKNRNLLQQLRQEVENYCQAAARRLGGGDLQSMDCFVGSIQPDLRHYREAYLHTLWLLEFADSRPGTPVFFYDYLNGYFQHQIPRSVYYHVFHVFTEILEPVSRMHIPETVDAFLKTNGNISAAGEILNLHRNTVAARIERMGDFLGLDPLHRNEDLNFLFRLSEFLKIS